MNKKVILLIGKSGSGKTYSLKKLINNHPGEVAYIDADGHGYLPFKGKGKIGKYIIPEDPLDVNIGVKKIEEDESIKYIVIDTLSHWLRILEQKHVISVVDSRGAWGQTYQAELFKLLDFATHESKKTWIFISHGMEGALTNDRIPQQAFVKGSTKGVGIESFFQFVVWVHEIEDDNSDRGIRNIFQVRKTKDTIDLSVKTPEDFSDKDYIDNDIEELIEMIDNYDQ